MTNTLQQREEEYLIKALQDLEGKYQELQKQYNPLTEIIGRLEEFQQLQSDPVAEFKTEQKLQALQNEREMLEKDMNWIESQMQDLRPLRVFCELLRLDCFEHIQQFEEFEPYQIGAFVLHGYARYALRLLLKRIVKKLSPRTTLMLLDLLAIQRNNSVDDMFSINMNTFNTDILWSELGRKFCPGRSVASPYRIASTIAQKLSQEHVVLVFKADITCDFNVILYDFWSNLVQIVQEKTPHPTHKFLLLLLVDKSSSQSKYDMRECDIRECDIRECDIRECDMNERYMCKFFHKWGISFVKKPDDSWTPDTPINLPAVDRYCAEDIQAWIRSSDDNIFPPGRRKNIPALIQNILEYSQNGFSDSVIEYICTKLCDCGFDEGGLEQWLKL